MSRLVILGVGNPLLGDDGTGLALLTRVGREAQLPPEAALVDGGTWGMNLLPVIEDATHLIVLDAIRTGAPPGTPVRLAREDLPRYLAHKLSPHQIDLKEVFALAEWRGTLPEYLVAIGVEPERVDWGTALSPVVEAGLAAAVESVWHELRRWDMLPVAAVPSGA
jgi:hydrogenase maturation protease